MSDINQILSEKINSTLEYFELFSYPLLAEEIYRFLGYGCSYEDVTNQLSLMVNNEDIFVSDEGFYSRVEKSDWSDERKAGNIRAEDLLNKASRYIKVIRWFPFVRSIAISGSLSKYYADEDADIDYFIIAAPNRLWISRTLLHFYKKLTFLRGNEHYYCMNYFIDESSLEIDQKNIYSAIETVTLIPVYNSNIIIKLKKENRWVLKYLPNEKFENDLRFLVSEKNIPIKRLLENFFNLFNADKLNLFFMNLTDRKWRLKWKKQKYPMDSYDEAFYTSPNISKNHPANFQAHVLKALDEKTTLSTQPTCKV